MKCDIQPVEQEQAVTTGVRVLGPEEFHLWNELVARSPFGTIFHTTWWYEAWRMQPMVSAVCDDTGQVQAGICYTTGWKIGTIGIVRPPLTARNGPIYMPTADPRRSKRYTRERRLVLDVINALPRLGMYDFVLGPPREDFMPFLWNGFDPLISHTYVIPHCEQRTWLQQTSPKFRYNLGKAKKEITANDYRIEEDAPIADVVRLVEQTEVLKQFTVPRLRERADYWWEAVRRHRAGRTYLVRDRSGSPVAGTILVHDNRCAYSIASGLRPDVRKSSHVRLLLVQRMIEDTHRMGLDYDFEGSVLPGVEQFARSFGGELRSVYRMVKLPKVLPFLIWQGYRYFHRHRHRQWVSYD